MRFLVAAVLLIGVSTASLPFQAERNVFHIPLLDDGYYALSVARNIALGNGITIDGSVPTNGFQPLFVFLSAPAFFMAGGDRVLGIRFVLVIHWLFYAGTAYLLGQIARDAFFREDAKKATTAFWLALFIYVSTLSLRSDKL